MACRERVWSPSHGVECHEPLQHHSPNLDRMPRDFRRHGWWLVTPGDAGLASFPTDGKDVMGSVYGAASSPEVISSIPFRTSECTFRPHDASSCLAVGNN